MGLQEPCSYKLLLLLQEVVLKVLGNSLSHMDFRAYL